MDDTSGRALFEARTRALESLGHRGSATDNEGRAAELVAKELRELSVPAAIEPFTGSDSLGRRLAVHVLVALVGLALLRIAPAVTAGVAAIVLVSWVVENRTLGLLLGRLAGPRPSRNVVGRIAAPDGAPQKTLVVCAHVDTQRTGRMWQGSIGGRLAPLYQRLPGAMRSPTFPVVAAFVGQAGLGLAEAVLPGTAVVLGLACAVGLVEVVAAYLLLDWARGPFVPGAADNATGVAAALELAERWSREPRPGVELVVLLTGCEESGALGAAAWATAHQAELAERPHAVLVLDTLAYGAPRFVDREHTLDAHQVRYPRGMVAICQDAAAELGLEGAGPHTLPTFTDGAAFAARGVPGIAILSFLDDVSMPNYHQMGDTSDNMDFDVGWRAVELAWLVLRAMADRWVPAVPSR